MTIDPSETDPRGAPFAHAPPPAGRHRAGSGHGAGLEAEARRRIGRNLRLLYGDVLDQPLPARFEALLATLATCGKAGESA